MACSLFYQLESYYDDEYFFYYIGDVTSTKFIMFVEIALSSLSKIRKQ